jgi:26S proteasome regulatory subunit N9
MDADKIPDFLADQRDQAPSEAQALFLDFEDYWERKLWHQLTNALVAFFRTPASAPQRLPIFKSFILSFADRINQLNFVSLGLLASTQCGGLSPFLSFRGLLVLMVLQTTKRDLLSSHH